MSETGKQANSGGSLSPAVLFLHTAGNLTLDRMPDGAPEGASWSEALSAWAREFVSPGQRKDLMRRLSPAALLKAYQSGKSRVLLDFTDTAGQKRRLTLQLSAKENSDELLATASLSPSVPVQPAAGSVKPQVHAEQPSAAAVSKNTAPAVSTPPEADAAPPASSESRPATDSSTNNAPFQVVLRGYPLFARFDLNHPSLSAADLLRDADSACADTAWPCTWSSFLKILADRFVRGAWRDEFLARFATEALRNASQEGKEQLSQTFSSDRGTWRMDIFLPEKGSDPAICCVGLCPVENDTAGKGLTVADPEAASARAAIADMQMEMEMERAETKKRHRRFSFCFALFAIIIGLMSGTVLDQKVTAFSDFVRQLLPSESEPTQEEPVERVAEEVVIPETVTSYVIFTEPATFTADVMENGTPRTNAASDNFQAVPFTVSVKEVMTPEDFSAKYAKAGYYLDGTEACAHLQLTFEDPGATSTVIPQDAFTISLLNAAGEEVQAYQLMDQPLGGNYSVSAAAGKTADLFKRFDYSADIRYLVLTWYQEGVRHDTRFALRYDDPNVSYPSLTIGDKGKYVTAMKQKLADLGYMTAKAAQNTVFTKETAAVVSTAQEAFGLEATGVADTAFLQTLYQQ